MFYIFQTTGVLKLTVHWINAKPCQFLSQLKFQCSYHQLLLSMLKFITFTEKQLFK